MGAPIPSRLSRRRILAALLLIPTLAAIAVSFWLQSDSIRAAVERQATNALGMPVRIQSARVSVFPRLGLALDHVQIGDPVQGAVDRMTVATGFALLVTRRVEGVDLQLSGGYVDASVLGGLAALGTTPSTGGDGAPFAIVSVRSIRFRDLTLLAGRERIVADLDASYAGDRLDISSLTAQLGSATIDVEGQLSSLSRGEGHFEIRSDSLPVDALLAAAGALAGGSGGRDSSLRPLRITAAISARVATLGDARIESLETRLQTTAAGIRFDPLTFTMDAGRFETRVSVDMSGQPTMLEGQGHVSGLDVGRIGEADPGGRTITGRLAARFTLRAPVAATMTALVGAARGPVDMEIRDGRMPGIEVIRQVVIRYANRNGPAVRAPGTDAFTLLKASLTFQAGTTLVTDLEMNTEDFDVTGSGTYLLSSGRISLAVDVTLSEALSMQAGRDLYRYARQDKRIVLPAVLGGTLSKPTATLDIGEAAGRALKNRIEEEAKSILDRMLKSMKENSR